MPDTNETPAGGTATPPEPEQDLTGRVLNEFKVIRLIGRGGMGEVYLADQRKLNRQVALKILRRDLVSNESYRKRFETEAKSVAPINHPNIVAVYSIGEDQGLHYMALEYVEGKNLREYVLKKGPVSVPVAINIMKKVASALQRAAEAGIIHRDIKPENILLTKKGEVKVADFGLARLRDQKSASVTQSGVTVGTPMYMSPEQVEGKPLDHRTDIYSFGVTCYQMLAGQPPFKGETAMAIAVQHVKGVATPLAEFRPDAPKPLIAMIEKMMARHRDDRYQSAREIVRELSRRFGDRRPEESQAEEEFDAPSGPNKSAPSTRLRLEAVSGRISRLSRTLRKPAMAATLFILAAGVGVAFGWLDREPDVFSLPAKAPTKPQIPSAVTRVKDAWFQLRYVRHDLKPELREAGLWSLLEDQYRGDVDITIEAAQELFTSHLSKRDYDKANLIADWLVERDNKKQQMFGYLFQGIVLSRQRRASDSNESFKKMLTARAGNSTEELGAEQLKWLARQYFLALGANWETLGEPRSPEMIDEFWRTFLSERS